MGDGVVFLEGPSILYANEAFRRMVGLTEEELSTLPSFFDLFPPADRDKDREKILSVRPGRKSADRFEVAVLGKQKGKVHLELTVSPLKNGPQARLLLLVRDLSEQKRLLEPVKEQEFQYR